MAESLYKYGDMRRKLIFLLFALIVCRIGAHIPVPGIDSLQLATLFKEQQGGILGIFNMFSGGALSRFTIFALGIMPYISSSIIMQLMGAVSPKIEALKKEGRIGEQKVSKYTRYLTVFLAAVQAYGISALLEAQGALVLEPGITFRLTSVISLVTGTMFLMWIGEQITERGLGNGISIIIFSGIVAGLPHSFVSLLNFLRTGSMNFSTALIIIALVFFITYFVVFVERGYRKILINYAKKQMGGRVYARQSSHLPLKLNMSGVMPTIFASSIILFPSTVAEWFGTSKNINWLKSVAKLLKHGQPVYIILYSIAIAFFCFFYTTVFFNSRETAENLKKSGAFIPGIRPGEQTAKYIDKILSRLTLIGALYILFVSLLPEILILRWKMPFYLGGTSLLIVVGVTMEFMSQVQSYVMSQKYDSLFKKVRLQK